LLFAGITCFKHVAKGEKHDDDARSESSWPVKSLEAKEEINNHSQDKRVIITYEITPELNTVLGSNRLNNSSICNKNQRVSLTHIKHTVSAENAQ
jgi:hypothetical protein